ncbi:hypothetical protein, variant [Aphanomyces invadans]|uniref:TNase-like domain-containing protein n=1 Tax=Aphanomyces invadans TaxID=157072 RepID=A0A024TEZ1_9STRA|nr:hypothetical protein, variant [Aphanomyces invadans]ETV92161.1 hypothetical protein, variant [Aphanomyces invadans]|eukprot:XP_008879125.1 hypothetical protein, variant [Aphanomyces invadans]
MHGSLSTGGYEGPSSLCLTAIRFECDTCHGSGASTRCITLTEAKTNEWGTICVNRGVGSFPPKKLKEHTLQIRLAGVDTPEMPHFGKECQPYAKEAKAWLLNELKDRVVTVTLLRRDQYGRAVCMVAYRESWWNGTKNVSEVLLRRGLAKVYRLSGAEYGGLLDNFNALENQAKEAKLNIWSQ